jgi:hypothetical protein
MEPIFTVETWWTKWPTFHLHIVFGICVSSTFHLHYVRVEFVYRAFEQPYKEFHKGGGPAASPHGSVREGWVRPWRVHCTRMEHGWHADSENGK